MAKDYCSTRNLRFLLYEVFNAPSLNRYPYYSEHNRETFDMIIDAAKQIGDNLLHPYLTEMDRKPPELVEGQIKVHPQVRTLMKTYGEGGWISANVPYEQGGQQLPVTLSNAALFIFGAANYSGCVYPFLSAGAANLIQAFGSEELKAQFIPRMYSGEWQGTMALTEPQAGSSLSDLITTAEPADNGLYKIKGQKIFISAGDHDAVDNVIHLMLARIKGAPAGTKGISLFVVPKKRIEDNGEGTQYIDNDVVTAGLYHKMGYKGAPIAHLMVGESDNCYGYLVGQPNKGLSYMFQMMNEARLAVGIGGASIASAAYYASLEYCRERPQGRPMSSKDASRPQSPIIEHADVKRMLLFQKSVVEGSLSLLLQCSMYADMARVTEGEVKEKFELLLDLLTPVAKTYPSEMSILSTSAGVQCLGGYGYCDDFPSEQFFRDTRIHTIHEGTTGIHGLDLLGRKVMMHNGKALKLLGAEMYKTIDEAQKSEQLSPYVVKLIEAANSVLQVTQQLLELAGKDRPEVFLADASLYLEYFGIVTVAWQWLVQGIKAEQAQPVNEEEANFYQGKLHAMKYFFAYELPKTRGLHERLANGDKLTVEMKEVFFN